MVQSGAVFVFDEHESGIKRWTDGLVWSPSRILGNFLVGLIGPHPVTKEDPEGTVLLIRTKKRKKVYRETGKRASPQSGAVDGSSGSPPTFGNGVQQFDDTNVGGALPPPNAGGRGHSRPGLSAAAMAGLDQFGQQHYQQMMNPPPYSPYAENGDEAGIKNGVDGMKVGGGGGGGSCGRTKERSLVGSLTNSYKFKDGGLVKKVKENVLRVPSAAVMRFVR
jgi:hypothetical protein